MILHLLPETTWLDASREPSYLPASFADDGFIHCSPDDDTMLRVANSFYRDDPAPMLALTIDEHLLTSEVRWEPANGSDRLADVGRFPHIYGPLDIDAVVTVRRFVRDPDGTYTGFVTPG